MNTLTLIALIIVIIFSALSIPGAEIIFDHKRWKKNLDDKHISTILRGVLFGIYSWVYHLTGYVEWYYALIFVVSSFIFIFDFALNITRWDRIKWMRGPQYSDRNLPDWFSNILVFLRRLCYHSNRGIDKIYSKIPPAVEILGKATILGIGIYLFLNGYTY